MTFRAPHCMMEQYATRLAPATVSYTTLSSTTLRGKTNCDFNLPLRSGWELRSSGFLRSE